MKPAREPLRTIVVGMDFAAAAEVALHRAADLAAVYGASLRVVHAFGWPTLADAAGAVTGDLVRELLGAAAAPRQRSASA